MNIQLLWSRNEVLVVAGGNSGGGGDGGGKNRQKNDLTHTGRTGARVGERLV